MLQAAVYGEQLLLRRRIEVLLGDATIRVCDSVENVGHTPVSHMLLYHCNLGYPLLDDGSELLIPARATTTSYGVPVAGYRTMGPPVAGAAEACFEHELIAEPDGGVPSALVNRALGVGMSVVSRLEPAAVPDRLADAGRGGLRRGARAQHQSGRRTLGRPGAG